MAGAGAADLHAADIAEEIHVPAAAPQLAVGHALQADVLLALDEARDLGVLQAAQLGWRDALGLALLARLEQVLRAKQAADVVRPEWRLRPRAVITSLRFQALRSGLQSLA